MSFFPAHFPLEQSPVPSAGVRWLSLGVPPSLQLASKHLLCVSTAVWEEFPTHVMLPVLRGR